MLREILCFCTDEYSAEHGDYCCSNYCPAQPYLPDDFCPTSCVAQCPAPGVV